MIATNEITDPDLRITDSPSLSSEMLHWLMYSVLLPLLYFALTLLVWWVIKHPATWLELLKSGGLVTYASTLSSKTSGEYVKSGSRVTTLTSLCLFGLICILASSAVVYGLLLSLGTAASQPLSGAPFVAPERLVEFSWSIAAVAVVFGLSFTLNGKLRARQS